MIVFINPSNLSILSTTISFSCLIIFSSFCYGLSANLVKKINNNTPLEIATFSTVLATILSFPVLVSHFFFSGNSEIFHLQNISLESFLSASILGVVCTGLAILIFFNLIKNKNGCICKSKQLSNSVFWFNLGFFIFRRKFVTKHALWFTLNCYRWVDGKSINDKQVILYQSD